MRLLIVSYEYPPLGGGGGVVVRALVGQLTARHDVTVLTSRGPGLPPESLDCGARIVRVPVLGRRDLQTASLPSMLSYVASARRCGRRLVREQRFDVVHTFFAVPSGPAGAAIARRSHAPHVLSLMGGDVYNPTRLINPDRFSPLRAVVGRVIRGADAVTSLSRDVAQRASRLSGRQDIEVLPCALEPPEPARSNRAQLGWGPDEVVVLAIARLIARKNLELLVRAVGSAGLPLRLEIVGDGPERKSLEALAAAVAPARVAFAGAVDAKQKALRLASADIFALVSLHEGFGLVYVEAMHAGLPVVAGNVGGQTDFIRDGANGLLVRPGDVAATARALGRLAGDPALRRRLAEMGQRTAAEYTPERLASQYVDLYERTLAARKTAAVSVGTRSNVRQQIAFYERQAARFDRSIWSLGNRDNRNHLVKVRAIADAIEVARGGTVLEVGTGTGLHARWLLENTAVKYTGVDASAAMLELARQRLERFEGRVTLGVADGHRLPFGDGTFDATFCFGTLHHLTAPKIGVGEIVRVTRPGGRVALMEPNWKFPSVLVIVATTREEWNAFKLSARSLADWGRAAGLVDVRLQRVLYTPPLPRSWAARWDAADRFIARVPGLRRLSIMLLLTGRVPA